MAVSRRQSKGGAGVSENLQKENYWLKKQLDIEGVRVSELEEQKITLRLEVVELGGKYKAALEDNSILQSELKEAEEIIEDLIYQHCEEVIIDGKEELFHGFLSANEIAFRYLIENGLAKLGTNDARITLVSMESKMTDREKIEQIIVNTLLKDSEIKQDPPEDNNDDEELPY